jgi:hypothetical protein
MRGARTPFSALSLSPYNPGLIVNVILPKPLLWAAKNPSSSSSLSYQKTAHYLKQGLKLALASNEYAYFETAWKPRITLNRSSSYI